MEPNDIKLYDYQKFAVNFLHLPGNKGLFLKMGLGKTLIVLEYLYQNSIINGLGRVLILGPKQVVKNVWPAEIKKWGYQMPIYVINSQSEARKAVIFRKENGIFLVSIDKVQSLILNGYFNDMDTIIIDESSVIKDETSKRFKALKKALAKKEFEKIIVLSGTPTPNSLDEIWTQIYVLDKGERLGTSKSKFMEKYFHGGFRLNSYVIVNRKANDNARDKIYEQISDIAISMESVKQFDLPERLDIPYAVQLSEPHFRSYRKLQKQFAVELDRGIVEASNSAVLVVKLQQYANGSMYYEDGTSQQIHDFKVEALNELIAGLDDNCLICYWFQQDKEILLRQCDWAEEFDLDSWNKRQQKVALIHPQSHGYGLNLQEGGSVIIWYAPIFSSELYQQMVARLHRQGQKSVVRNYILVMERTIDTHIYDVLNGKIDEQDLLMKALDYENTPEFDTGYNRKSEFKLDDPLDDFN